MGYPRYVQSMGIFIQVCVGTCMYTYAKGESAYTWFSSVFTAVVFRTMWGSTKCLNPKLAAGTTVVLFLCLYFWWLPSLEQNVTISAGISAGENEPIGRNLPTSTPNDDRRVDDQLEDEDETISTDTDRLLRFLPNDTDRCQNVLPGVSRNISLLWTQDIVEQYDEFRDTVRKLKQPLEGHSGKFPEQILTYIHIVRIPFIRTVCETGFNAGHSTFTWLSANPNVHVYSFDMGKHRYSKPMAEFLSTMFPGRLTLTWGDSTKTLPLFCEQNPDVRCDLVSVDGGHSFEVAQADINNFRRMANRKNVLVFDDYPAPMFDPVLGPIWEGGKKNKTIKENFKCNRGYFARNSHGFSVGQYLL